MRFFKLLSAFLALQLISFAVWKVGFSDAASNQAPTVDPNYVHSALELASASITQASASESMAVTEISVHQKEVSSTIELPHFSAKNTTNSEDQVTGPIQENQIAQVLKHLPVGHAETLKEVTLDYDPAAHRGLGGGSLIIMRAVDMSTEEFLAVFVHELGHNVDYAYLTPSNQNQTSPFKDAGTPLFESDPSLDFYRISWSSNQYSQSGTIAADFVSGYAMTDPFEDFAETYVYYVLHNREFESLTENSEALKAKYNFMKDHVFNGKVFDTGDMNVEPVSQPWDITVLPYDLSGFLGASPSLPKGEGQN